MLKLIEDFFRNHKNEIKILNSKERGDVESKLSDKVVFGHDTINWDKHPNNLKLGSLKDLDESLQESTCYFICENYDTPIVATKFMFIFNHFEEMSRFSFNSWIVEVDFNWLIEEHHEKGLIFTKIN